ncbi:lysozyme [soil metagenome]
MAGEITPAQAKTAIGALGSGAVFALAMAVSALPGDEGKANIDYLDIAKVPTNCFGHTGPDVRVGQYKSDAQCEALLSADAKAHLQGALRCTPGLANRPYQLAAVTRLAFNIGVPAYCRSTIARRFNAGDLRGGCNGFPAWNKARVNGRLVVVRGLADRRERERAQCLTGLSA